ncbi:MAG: helix-hairpin-helix domain-containing protein [Chloroflexota bacterium]|nr:helix-hairpin-helix domain-containing protein [Chloroflexota bacterium]
MQISRVDQLLLAAGGLLVVALGGLGFVIVGHGAPGGDEADLAVVAADPFSTAEIGPSAAAPSGAATLVVDVEGAVRAPGVYQLRRGARVADAIAAAGGYDETVDLDAAAAQLNLALVVQDEQKILVPLLGAAASAAPAAAGGTGTDDRTTRGPLNLNTASAAELEDLPGIGPVTAERIIEARREQPFTSLQELVDRGVINRGQLEDIANLATVS